MKQEKVYNTKKKKAIAKTKDFLAEATELVLQHDDMKALAEEAMNDFQAKIMLFAAKAFIDEEVRTLCGKKHQTNKEKECCRYGTQKSGHITLSGQKVKFPKPRVRTKDGKHEVELSMYKKFKNPIDESALRNMLHGVSTRNYELVVDAISDGYGVKRSSVSRGFVKETRKALEEFSERKLDEYFPVIYIDGYPVAGDIFVVALGVGYGEKKDGKKVVLSMKQGRTENKEVIKALFDDIEARGVHTDKPILFIIDGGKAIRAAIEERFPHHFIQRCREHKRRNIMGICPEKHKEGVELHLDDLYAERDYETALKKLCEFEKYAETITPDLAASVREGLKDTLTIVKLEVPDKLFKTLKTTNPIESLNSMFKTFSHRVKHWRDGDMKKRWHVAAALEAEARMKRVHGYMALTSLVKKMCEEKNFDSLAIDRKTA